MKEGGGDFIILDPTFSYFWRSLDDWEIAWDVVPYPVAYTTTNLLSQGAGKNTQPFISICVATVFTGGWLLSGSLTYLFRPAVFPSEHASPSSCLFKQFLIWYRKRWSPDGSSGTLCRHNHHVYRLSPGIDLSNSWFIRWSPKLWVLPCTYLGLLLIYTLQRKSRAKSPGLQLVGEILGSAHKRGWGQKWPKMVVCSLLSETAEFGAVPGLCQAPAAAAAPGDLLSCTELGKCGISWTSSLCPGHIPFLGKEWEKTLPSGNRHMQCWVYQCERISAAIWENSHQCISM